MLYKGMALTVAMAATAVAGPVVAEAQPAGLSWQPCNGGPAQVEKGSRMATVRPARRSDLARLVAIYNHYVEHSVATFDTDIVSVESRTAWFDTFSDTGPHRLVVACEGDRVLGCASSSPYRAHPAFAETVEFGIYLDPRSRGAGVGSALYRVLLEQLSSEEVRLAVAGIALPNDASVALHRKFGFTDVGVFKEYATKRGVYISSLWLQRRIGPLA